MKDQKYPPDADSSKDKAIAASVFSIAFLYTMDFSAIHVRQEGMLSQWCRGAGMHLLNMQASQLINGKSSSQL